MLWVRPRIRRLDIDLPCDWMSASDFRLRNPSDGFYSRYSSRLTCTVVVDQAWPAQSSSIGVYLHLRGIVKLAPGPSIWAFSISECSLSFRSWVLAHPRPLIGLGINGSFLRLSIYKFVENVPDLQ